MAGQSETGPVIETSFVRFNVGQSNTSLPTSGHRFLFWIDEAKLRGVSNYFRGLQFKEPIGPIELPKVEPAVFQIFDQFCETKTVNLRPGTENDWRFFDPETFSDIEVTHSRALLMLAKCYVLAEDYDTPELLEAIANVLRDRQGCTMMESYNESWYERRPTSMAKFVNFVYEHTKTRFLKQVIVDFCVELNGEERTRFKSDLDSDNVNHAYWDDVLERSFAEITRLRNLLASH